MNAGKRKWIARIGPLGPEFQLRIRVQFYKTDKNDLSILQKSSFLTLFLNFGLPRLVLISFFSAEWFGTEFRDFASIFVPRNGISSQFLFRWGVRKGIPRDCFYFLFNGTEFRVIFSSAEGFGTEFRDFLFRGTAGIPSEIPICSVYSVFRGIIFCRKFPTLILTL